jgi:rhamnosyltransferase
VDTEWCLRALSKGYRLFGVPGARMMHTLGDRRTRIWFLRWRNVPYHSPFRYYYILRNGLLLQKRPYIPIKWKTAELYRALRVFLFYGFFAKGASKRRRLMWRGLMDGFRGITGKLLSPHA